MIFYRLIDPYSENLQKQLQFKGKSVTMICTLYKVVLMITAVYERLILWI